MLPRRPPKSQQLVEQSSVSRASYEKNKEKKILVLQKKDRKCLYSRNSSCEVHRKTCWVRVHAEQLGSQNYAL